MKKYLFMILAMICMAFTATVLTSCGSDDEEEKAYTLTLIPYTYDPANQLTSKQKTALEAIVVKTGSKTIKYNNEKEVEAPSKAWFQGMASSVGQLIISDPSIIMADKAGIKVAMTTKGQTEYEYLTFGSLLEELQK